MRFVFKIFFIFICIFSLFIIVAAKVPYVRHQFARYDKKEDRARGYFSGNLYYMCKIDKFKGNYMIFPHKEKDTIEDALIMVMGDSYTWFDSGSPIYADLLEIALEEKVYQVPSRLAADKPLNYLKSIGYERGKNKILILQSTERHAMGRAHDFNNTLKQGARSKLAFLINWRKKIFNNDDVEFFFLNNKLTYGLLKNLKQVKFDLFGEIDSRMAVFSQDPDMLFYYEDVDFYRSEETDAEIKKMVKNIVTLKNDLKKKYDIDLIYSILPEKYTIYKDFVTEQKEYDGFIPKVVLALNREGVETIDMYQVYMDYREKNKLGLLYYPQDTHFTPLGKSIFVKELMHAVKGVQMKNESILSVAQNNK